jgi:hypothetical protein
MVDGATAVIAWPVIALVEELLLLAVSDFWLEQAERPRIATALRPAATIAVQCLGFMTVHSNVSGTTRVAVLVLTKRIRSIGQHGWCGMECVTIA